MAVLCCRRYPGSYDEHLEEDVPVLKGLATQVGGPLGHLLCLCCLAFFFSSRLTLLTLCPAHLG